MKEGHNSFSLVIFYLGAFLSPLLAARLRVPAAVAEILFGILIGENGLRLVQPAAFTDFLSQLGITFLMFLVGTEIDFNHIRREGLRSVLVSVVVAAGILGTGVALARLGGFSPFLGLALRAMSCGILLVALVERGLQKTRLGQLLLLVGSVGEFLTLFALTGFNLVYRFGIGPQLVVEIGRALFLFLAAYVLLALLRVLVWWAPKRFQRLVDSHDPSEIGVRAGFVLMLSLAALASLVGMEAILGSFLAGALFSFVFRQRGVLDAKLSAVGQGFFIPIFFIHVGTAFNAHALADPMSAVKTVLLLAGASLLSKGLPLLLLRLLGVPLRQIVAGAFLLSSPLTLLVAVAALGKNIGILDERGSASLILLAILSGIVFPTVFKLLLGAKPPA